MASWVAAVLVCLPSLCAAVETCKNSSWILTRSDAAEDNEQSPSGVEVTQMWSGIVGKKCSGGGDLKLTTTWDGTFLLWPGKERGQVGDWNFPGWVVIDQWPVFALPVMADDKVFVRLPTDFSGAVAFKESEYLEDGDDRAGGFLTVGESGATPPGLSTYPEVLVVGARVWADRSAVFTEVPPLLRDAAFWPGLGYAPPGPVDFTADVEGTAFIIANGGFSGEFESDDWLEVQPGPHASHSSGGGELRVWARPVSPGPALRIFKRDAAPQGALIAFRPSDVMSTPDFVLDSPGTPGTPGGTPGADGGLLGPRALTPGAQLWPGSSILLSEVPDVLDGAPFWPTGNPKDSVFTSETNGTLIVFLEPGSAPLGKPWTSVGPVVWTVGPAGSRGLVGWARPVAAREPTEVAWPGLDAPRTVIVFVTKSEVNVINALAELGSASAPPPAAPSSIVMASTASTEKSSSNEKVVTTIVKEKPFVLGIAIMSGVGGFLLFALLYYMFLRRRRREKYVSETDYLSRASGMSPIIIDPKVYNLTHIDTE